MHATGSEPSIDSSARPVTLNWLCPQSGEQRSLEVELQHSQDQLIVRGDGFLFDLAQPARLLPTTIGKPWGEELWYSGAEVRGESRVAGVQGSLPLSAYLALDPPNITAQLPVVLLKILASKPIPIDGELYLEVHQHKAEAYLVTHIDEHCWPEGRARLRYGLSDYAHATFPDSQALRRALLETAQALETEPTDTQRRAELLALIGDRSIAVGSRISIAPGIPHGLPHGVRVIEFQTPTYERLILAAGQPVVTQEGWDCEAAVDHLLLEPGGHPEPAPEPMATLPSGQQPLARFADFGARVLALRDHYPPMPLSPSRGAAVVMCSQGRIKLGGLTLAAEEAALVPALALQRTPFLECLESHAECVIAAADY